MTRDPNPYLLIEERLADEDKIEFLRKTVEADPKFDGAYIADILDIYHDSDAMIAVVDPYWDAHGAALVESGYDNTVVGVAATAAAVLESPDADLEAVHRRVLGLVAE